MSLSAVRSPRGQRSAIGVSAERQEVLKHFNGLRNTASNITGIFEYSLEPEGSGTRVRFTCDIEPHGLMWLTLPFALRSNRARYVDQLDRLKAAIEGRT